MYLDQDTPLAERICTLFQEQGITILSVMPALSMTISTIALAMTGVFGVGGGKGGFLPKDEGGLKKMVG